jgi:hypothetical protein
MNYFANIFGYNKKKDSPVKTSSYTTNTEDEFHDADELATNIINKIRANQSKIDEHLKDIKSSPRNSNIFEKDLINRCTLWKLIKDKYPNNPYNPTSGKSIKLNGPLYNNLEKTCMNVPIDEDIELPEKASRIAKKAAPKEEEKPKKATKKAAPKEEKPKKATKKAAPKEEEKPKKATKKTAPKEEKPKKATKKTAPKEEEKPKKATKKAAPKEEKPKKATKKAAPKEEEKPKKATKKAAPKEEKPKKATKKAAPKEEKPKKATKK